MKRSILSGFVIVLWMITASPASAQSPDPTRDPVALLRAIVRVDATIPPDARTAETLGTERTGSGVVIDSGGLILTIGYLIMEAATVEVRTSDGRAYPADIVAYDHTTGFGLLRGGFGFDAAPVRLGRSERVAMGDPMLAIGFGGSVAVAQTRIASKREFAGSWEYLLDEAIFTTPPHPHFGGAALIDGRGELVGIGSLMVAEAVPGHGLPGNMFVPIDALMPILGDLIAFGRRGDPAPPWLGITSRETHDQIFIDRVAPDGPAAVAGLQRNDRIVGLAGEPVDGLADFYRKIRNLGAAGVAVPVDIQRGSKVETVIVASVDRNRFLRLNSTF
jgi:S1-C subfamily serine protease